MKLTIITGPQGSGKTYKLQELCKNKNVARYENSRLNSYPIHLPQFTDNIECITFDAVYSLAHILRLAAIMDEEILKYKITMPGITCERLNTEIVITTQIPKRKLLPIFRSISNIHFRELKQA